MKRLPIIEPEKRAANGNAARTARHATHRE
jgi:hypothetical protein